MTNYQPCRDRPSLPYQRECLDRYQPIKTLATKFKRPFSVLDIGANIGWFCHSLVNDFAHSVTFPIDNKSIAPCHPRIHHIPRHVSGETLLELGKSEHFDIVLALSVLHHFTDYDKAIEALECLGSHVFVEIPGPEDKNAANPKRHAKIQASFELVDPIAYFPSHVSSTMRPMYYQRFSPLLTRQTLDADKRGAPTYATYSVTEDFDRTEITIRRDKKNVKPEIRPFVPGMNLHNFRLLGGKVPVPKTPGHNDDKPWNYIIGYEKEPTPIDNFIRKIV